MTKVLALGRAMAVLKIGIRTEEYVNALECHGY